MTIDSLFYLVMIILGGGMMLIGMGLSIGLLNLLTIPIWMFLAIEWSSEPLLVITMIAVMFFQIYWVVRSTSR